MRHLLAAVLVAAPLTAAGAGAEPQLDIVPRTAEEAARVAAATASPEDFSKPERFESRPAGAATVEKRRDANVFSHSSANMPFERELDFKVGNGLFRKLWVTAPASTRVSDGLGPLFNARGCQNCHLKDARGHPPAGPADAPVALFLRLSVPADPAAPPAPYDAIEDYLAARPEPTYGEQLQTFGIPGHPAEARLRTLWAEEPVTLADGSGVSLRRPEYRIEDPAYGPLDPEVMTSPRIAPQMIGLGLVEAIPAADILARADPDDADGDGVSGRANIVWSDEFEQPMLGRFGHKAGKPTIRSQSAAALSGDIGISTWLHPDGSGECTPAETACRAAPDGGSPEADETVLDLITFYSRNLAVPARRDPGDPQVLAGKQLFHDAGCAGCHQPKFVTHRLRDRPEQSFQLIWPYSDFLLHDMGAGLADGRPEARATGSEWRTAPLWGIGLTETVTGRQSYLHDGRARSLLEAILWHGGEAAPARDAVAGLSPEDRAALIRFLESL